MLSFPVQARGCLLRHSDKQVGCPLAALRGPKTDIRQEAIWASSLACVLALTVALQTSLSDIAISARSKYTSTIDGRTSSRTASDQTSTRTAWLARTQRVHRRA
ncbi:hypothetical protein MRB53_037077 [Persea americana]|nr:hypothetical protein MRB53_037077 [Persea americana]